MIDDKHANRNVGRLQLEAELLLDGCKDTGDIRLGGGIGSHFDGLRSPSKRLGRGRERKPRRKKAVAYETAQLELARLLLSQSIQRSRLYQVPLEPAYLNALTETFCSPIEKATRDRNLIDKIAVRWETSGCPIRFALLSLAKRVGG